MKCFEFVRYSLALKTYNFSTTATPFHSCATLLNVKMNSRRPKERSQYWS